MGTGRVLCDGVLRRRMRTCVLSVSSTVGRSVDPGTTSRHQVPRQKEKQTKRTQALINFPQALINFPY